jgi:Fe-Mn family superoxide dismutase
MESPHRTAPHRTAHLFRGQNGLIAGTENEGRSLEELVQTASGGLFNNAAQVWNHNFYWHSMAPNAGGEPTGPIAEAIQATWGSFEEFKKAFNQEAANHFASGWAWLVKKDGALRIVSTHDASNPIREDLGTPILTCDVWEHAYYIGAF